MIDENKLYNEGVTPPTLQRKYVNIMKRLSNLKILSNGSHERRTTSMQLNMFNAKSEYNKRLRAHLATPYLFQKLVLSMTMHLARCYIFV